MIARSLDSPLLQEIHPAVDGTGSAVTLADVPDLEDQAIVTAASRARAVVAITQKVQDDAERVTNRHTSGASMPVVTALTSTFFTISDAGFLTCGVRQHAAVTIDQGRAPQPPGWTLRPPLTEK